MDVKLRYLNTQREKMSPMVRAYWAELDQAHEMGRPVVYCLGFVPQELFRAIDCAVFFGENFGAGCAVARVSQELCQVAESRGFPMELCSYARTHIGAMATGRNPMGKSLPKPDLVAYNNGRCATYPGWGKVIKELFPDVAVVALDVPPLRDGMPKDEYDRASRYLKQQLESIVRFLDGWKGRRFDRAVFDEGVDNTARGARALLALQQTLHAKPAPISLVDIFVQLFPMVCLRGRPDIEQYYSAAKAEVEERIAQGYAAVPDERFRVYWDGIAIWTRLSNQFQQLARHSASLVSAAYTYNIADNWVHLDSSRPMETLADGLMRGFHNQGVRAKADYVARLVQDSAVDGIIMQVSRSCKAYFMDELALIRQVSERTGIPYCEVHGDMADPRLYSEHEIETRIDAFLERLASSAKAT